MKQANDESVAQQLAFYRAKVVASFYVITEFGEDCVNRLPRLLCLGMPSLTSVGFIFSVNEEVGGLSRGEIERVSLERPKRPSTVLAGGPT